MTPNLAVIVGYLEAKYDLADVQITNCRPIAGSKTWSQHSWSNGADLFAAPATLDLIADDLRRTFEPGIAHLLWRVPSHFDHIHLDPWPIGHGTPPCAGGRLQVRYEDGRISNSFTLDLTPPTSPEADNMLPITPSSAIEDIRALQDRLNLAYASGLAVDGIYGPATVAVVRDRLGGFTGDPEAQAGNRVVARQWNRLTLEMVRSQAPGSGGLSEDDVKAIVNGSQIVAP